MVVAALSGSERGILLVDKMAVGAKEFWSSDLVLENRTLVGPLQGGLMAW